MEIIKVSVTDAEHILLQNAAQRKGLTISEFIRQSALETVEEASDLLAFKKAEQEFKRDPVTYSTAEVKRQLNL
ncbi:type II toxin-antitoxin system RelB family antitoxin [Furfurilactobacillus siliginis]|uniref:CopG family transcriptional regulator n=1 Tax=Furfurilactobacillus siliginis TaxID=348151 RepID=A0A0R2L355_9LACO|nr:DUF6290 family protein [Furfurilactobacillus siliginis]KRN96017.1 hypothetical protein IV55_GL001695 [Furfurilactobacillus siliginis]GEK28832.1 hypothetical protein LSI01_11430 [Furfurilactobacillus siliginis]